VLVMSAGQDRLIPPSHSRDLVAALGGSAQLLEFSDNGPPPIARPGCSVFAILLFVPWCLVLSVWCLVSVV
jgi:hypothetical protein